MKGVKSSQSWRRHMPQRPQKVRRAVYSAPNNNTKKIVVKIIWVIVGLLLIQSIFQLPFLKVDQINLTGNRDLNTDEVLAAINKPLNESKWLLFKNNNFFLLDTVAIETILLSSFNLDDVVVDKKFPDMLDVHVTEKISHFIWKKDDSLYLLDAKGVLNRQIGGPDEKYIILADNRTNIPSGDQKFTDEEITIINQVYLNWIELIGEAPKLMQVNVYDNPSAWELITSGDFFVKLNADEPIEDQISNLYQILTAGNISGEDVDYIDVRFGDKIYLK